MPTDQRDNGGHPFDGVATGRVALPPGVDVVLRPPRPTEAGFLYSLAARWPESWRRVCRDGLPTPHQFEALVSFGVVASRVIEVVVFAEVRQVGLVTLFDGDERAGTVWLDNVGLRGPDNDAVRDEATVRMIDDAFRGPYRKVYARHVGHDAPPLGFLPGPVREEARLVDQVIHDDFAWDEVISAVYREDWPGAAP